MAPSTPSVRHRIRSSFRKTDMDRALDLAEKRGIEIGAIEVTSDGTIRIVAKNTDQNADTPENIITKL
jgi:hypothetical protein